MNKIPDIPHDRALPNGDFLAVSLKGEKISGISLNAGYNHLGIEKFCESCNYNKNIHIFERLCGPGSCAQSIAFCQGAEMIAGIDIPQRAGYIRVIAAELERIDNHLLQFAFLSHDIGFDTLSMYIRKDREEVLDIAAMLFGNRIVFNINTIGGVRRDMDTNQADIIGKTLAYLEERDKYYLDLVTKENTLLIRLSGVGSLSSQNAARLCTVGPVARMANISKDIRVDDPYAAYRDIPVSIVNNDRCDILGLVLVWLGEIRESINIIRYALDNLPDGEIKAPAPENIPCGEEFSRSEAPAGENSCFIMANGTDMPERVKLTLPQFTNLPSLTSMLEGNYLADLPLIINAVDLHYFGSGRTVVLNDIGNGRQRIFNRQELRQYSIDFYRQQGIDVNNVKVSKTPKTL